MSGETCAERCNVYKILHAFKSKQENGPVGHSSHACDTMFWFDRICFKRLFREKKQQDSSRSRWTEGQSKEATSPQWILCYSLTACMVFADCGGAGVPGRAWTVLHNNPSSALASSFFFSLRHLSLNRGVKCFSRRHVCVCAHAHVSLFSLPVSPRPKDYYLKYSWCATGAFRGLTANVSFKKKTHTQLKSAHQHYQCQQPRFKKCFFVCLFFIYSGSLELNPHSLTNKGAAEYMTVQGKFDLRFSFSKLLQTCTDTFHCVLFCFLFHFILFYF